MGDEKKKKKYCIACGEKYFKCRHVTKKTCMCKETDLNHVILRGYCIFCLFDGKKKFEERWDSLSEVLIGIGLGIYNLGYIQAMKGDRALYLCQTKDGDVENMHVLYKAGYDAGTTKNH
jgi:hypothetical protein